LLLKWKFPPSFTERKTINARILKSTDYCVPEASAAEITMVPGAAKNKKSPDVRDSLSLPECQRRFFLYVSKTATVLK